MMPIEECAHLLEDVPAGFSASFDADQRTLTVSHGRTGRWRWLNILWVELLLWVPGLAVAFAALRDEGLFLVLFLCAGAFISGLLGVLAAWYWFGRITVVLAPEDLTRRASLFRWERRWSVGRDEIESIELRTDFATSGSARTTGYTVPITADRYRIVLGLSRDEYDKARWLSGLLSAWSGVAVD